MARKNSEQLLMKKGRTSTGQITRILKQANEGVLAE